MFPPVESPEPALSGEGGSTFGNLKLSRVTPFFLSISLGSADQARSGKFESLEIKLVRSSFQRSTRFFFVQRLQILLRFATCLQNDTPPKYRP